MISGILILAALLIPSSSVTRNSALPQCFRFDRPLGTSASGARELADSTWYIVQLADSGIVRRPLQPKREREAWLRKNQWSAIGDTIHFRVGDPLVGWNVTMHRVGRSFTGVATYISDVIVAGRAPTRVPVHAKRVRCPALPRSY